MGKHKGYLRKKIPGGGGGGGGRGGGGGGPQPIYFSMGGLVRKDFKLYGSLVSDQIKLHGWLVFRAWKGRKEYCLPKIDRSFIKSIQKKALSLANRSGHFCLHAIVKPQMFPSNIGKKRYGNKLPNSGFCSGHYFTWETCIFR